MSPQTPSEQPRDSVPLYALYGEDTVVEDSSFIHIEDIEARSRLYDWEISSHTHRGLFQTIVVFSGRAEVHLDDTITHLDAPGAVTIPPTVVHAFKFLPGTRGYVLTVSEALMLEASSRRGRVLFDNLFLQPRVLDLGGDPVAVMRMAGLLEHLLDELQSTRRGHNSMSEWLAKSVIMLIERQHAALFLDDKASQARAAVFTKFRELVETHYLDHWSLAQYADALGVTPSKLNRISKALSGKSAFQVTQDRLVLEARRRLVYIAAPVQALAFELGFEDPGYFNRFFKRHTGQTPAAFRRDQHAKLA